MTASSSPDPATPQWTWTGEARRAVLAALGIRPGEEWDGDGGTADAVLAALAPHVALQVAELRRLVAGLEAENDNYHADLIRVIGERNAALAKVDAAEAMHQSMHQSDGFAYCRHCGHGWPCPTYRVVAADPQRPVPPPEDAQESGGRS